MHVVLLAIDAVKTSSRLVGVTNIVVLLPLDQAKLAKNRRMLSSKSEESQWH